MEAWFLRPDVLRVLFRDRVLAFDENAGLIWAQLMEDGKANVRPSSGLDMIIAAVAVENGYVVVTDNEKNFMGIEIINPMGGAK